MQRNVPRCGALARYEKDAQKEKDEGGVDAEGAQADDGTRRGARRNTVRPDDHCGEAYAEVALCFLAVRSPAMVDAERHAILNGIDGRPANASDPPLSQRQWQEPPRNDHQRRPRRRDDRFQQWRRGRRWYPLPAGFRPSLDCFELQVRQSWQRDPHRV